MSAHAHARDQQLNDMYTHTHTEPSQPARQNWPEKFQPKSEKQNFYTGTLTKAEKQQSSQATDRRRRRKKKKRKKTKDDGKEKKEEDEQGGTKEDGKEERSEE